MTDRVYRVMGMTCLPCVTAVSDEVSRVAGVDSVSVDLAGGIVTVSGEGYRDDGIRDAVDQAGCEVVDE